MMEGAKKWRARERIKPKTTKENSARLEALILAHHLKVEKVVKEAREERKGDWSSHTN